MASPQLEDGYTRLANEIIEALMRTNLSAYQGRILMTVLRLTYGWKKKEDFIRNKRIVDLTGLKKAHVSRTISELIARNIVTKAGNKIAFNKDYQSWRELPKRVTVTNSGNSVTDWGYRMLPDGATTSRVKRTKAGLGEGLKKRKKPIKRNTLSEADLALFDNFYKTYPKHQGNTPALKAWKKLNPGSSLCRTIMEALENQKAHREGLKKSGTWCPEWPLPSTWLNNKRWEDEIPVEATQTSTEGYFSNGRDDL